MIPAPRAALAAFFVAIALPAAAQAPGAPDGAGGTPALPAARARPPARPAGTRRPQVAVARPTPAVRTPATLPPLPATREKLPANGETWSQITLEAANAVPTRFPLGRGHEGPSVLHLQVLLERALFSPGMLDGKWGRNTEVAVYWLQAREGLTPTGMVDSATYQRLRTLAGAAEAVRMHELTAEDVRGPFVTIPGDIYQHARLSCSCYESLGEKLSETFHSRTELLRRLNPGMDLNALTAGTRIAVPVVRAVDVPPAGEIAELWVSGQQNYLQAVDAQGRILYHFPTTLGSTYDPSPQGDFSVRGVHPNPWWHYQPKILAHVPDDRPDARIPPGPNSSVGRVWIALSAPHYGIHGTKSPETIGYATSAGCVRLTNWDVTFLSQRVRAGTPVRFRDTRRDPAQTPAQPAARPQPAGPDVLGVRSDSARGGAAPAAARADSAAPVRTDSAAPVPPAARPDSSAAPRPAPLPAAPPAPTDSTAPRSPA